MLNPVSLYYSDWGLNFLYVSDECFAVIEGSWTEFRFRMAHGPELAVSAVVCAHFSTTCEQNCPFAGAE